MSEGAYSRFLEVLARNTEQELPPADELGDVPLRELGFDSMHSVSLLLDLEETFELSFTDDYLSAEVFESSSTLWAATEALVLARGVV